ncbi:MAG: lysophospholipid acyltransferase family protein [Deltaproteobacteria bacterium]|nr:lysophospholipid acyltransferase family protein [Deltaproteobacteria bacterium]
MLALFFCLAAILPLRIQYGAATVVGTIASYLFPGHRRRIMENMDLAFGKEKSRKEKTEICQAATVHVAKHFFELAASLNDRQKNNLNRSIHVVGCENLEGSLRKGKGVIAVSGHIGNFTIVGVKMKDAGYRFHTVIREFSDPVHRKLYAHYCSIHDQLLIPSRPYKEAMSRILGALRNNEIVMLVTDENKRHGGVFVDFFNRKASTNAGPAILHLRTGADIIPIFMVRNRDNTHTIMIEPPLLLDQTRNLTNDAGEITQLITSRIENHIRKYPDQWLWTNRRWRTRPPEAANRKGADTFHRQ